MALRPSRDVLTIFGIPKPFEGHIGLIQHNAIQSWLRLHPEIQVLLCGDEPGTQQVARDLGTGFVGDVARSAYGTPLLSSAFARAQAEARHRLLCYVNCDIVLLPDLVEAVQRVMWEDFLLMGRRKMLDVEEPLDFGNPGWAEELRRKAAREGVLGNERSRDYFILPVHSALLRGFPDFIVGRPYWDDWLPWRAAQLGLPILDLSPAVLAVHQNHGYGHVPQQRGSMWDGPEADHNLQFLPSRRIGKWHTTLDASYVMGRRGIRYRPSWLRVLRRQLLWSYRGLLQRAVRQPWLVGLVRTLRRALGAVWPAATGAQDRTVRGE